MTKSQTAAATIQPIAELKASLAEHPLTAAELAALVAARPGYGLLLAALSAKGTEEMAERIADQVLTSPIFAGKREEERQQWLLMHDPAGALEQAAVAVGQALDILERHVEFEANGGRYVDEPLRAPTWYEPAPPPSNSAARLAEIVSAANGMRLSLLGALVALDQAIRTAIVLYAACRPKNNVVPLAHWRRAAQDAAAEPEKR